MTSIEYDPYHRNRTDKISNNLFVSTDQTRPAVLVLVDLSTAFDVIDHDILPDTLCNKTGVDGPALEWFVSYRADV